MLRRAFVLSSHASVGLFDDGSVISLSADASKFTMERLCRDGLATEKQRKDGYRIETEVHFTCFAPHALRAKIRSMVDLRNSYGLDDRIFLDRNLFGKDICSSAKDPAFSSSLLRVVDRRGVSPCLEVVSSGTTVRLFLSQRIIRVDFVRIGVSKHFSVFCFPPWLVPMIAKLGEVLIISHSQSVHEDAVELLSRIFDIEMTSIKPGFSKDITSVSCQSCIEWEAMVWECEDLTRDDDSAWLPLARDTWDGERACQSQEGAETEAFKEYTCIMLEGNGESWVKSCHDIPVDMHIHPNAHSFSQLPVVFVDWRPQRTMFHIIREQVVHMVYHEHEASIKSGGEVHTDGPHFFTLVQCIACKWRDSQDSGMKREVMDPSDYEIKKKSISRDFLPPRLLKNGGEWLPLEEFVQEMASMWMHNSISMERDVLRIRRTVVPTASMLDTTILNKIENDVGVFIAYVDGRACVRFHHDYAVVFVEDGMCRILTPQGTILPVEWVNSTWKWHLRQVRKFLEWCHAKDESARDEIERQHDKERWYLEGGLAMNLKETQMFLTGWSRGMDGIKECLDTSRKFIEEMDSLTNEKAI